MGVSNFGVLAHIWDVGPNLKIQSNSIFNLDLEHYSLVRIALVVVELFQKNPILKGFGVVTGV